MSDDSPAMEVDYILRGLPCALLVLRPDPHFTVVAATDAFLEVTRTRRDQLVGRGAFEIMSGTKSDGVKFRLSAFRASLARVVAAREPDVMAIQRTTGRLPEAGPRAAERFWRPVNSPVLGPEGELRYILHRLEDVTEVERLRSLEAFLDVRDVQNPGPPERIRQHVALEHRHRIYEAALANTPDLIYVFDLAHRFIYANEALLRMWGKNADEALGRTCLELGYEPWHAEMHGCEIDQVVATRQPIRGEVPFTGANGRRFYDYIFVPVFGADGEVVAVAGSTRDITDRQRAEQAIREQAASLREADRTKDEFIATLSHELRNPLAPIRNALSLIRLAGSSDGTTLAVHAMMERQVNHLVRLVDDLLEMSRITRGSLLLRKEPVEVATVVHNAIETNAPLIEASRHSLKVELPDEKLWLEGDPVRLAQVVANLLDNAAKYTDDGGEITVRVTHGAGNVEIAVRDNGVGLAEDEIPRLFEMFRRGDGERREQGGLGIGLALARRLTELHGGRIEATSAGPRKGSTFSVHLPLLRSEPVQPFRAASLPVPVAPTRILLVDDNRDGAESLGMLLGLLGADVRVAHDGPAALEAFGSFLPGLVLLDLGMPGMDGYEVARALRTRWPDQRPILAALTGWGQDEDRRRTREAGFDYHLVKPAELDALQELLAGVAENADRSSRSNLASA